VAWTCRASIDAAPRATLEQQVGVGARAAVEYGRPETAVAPSVGEEVP
jgi:hypothetical protein